MTPEAERMLNSVFGLLLGLFSRRWGRDQWEERKAVRRWSAADEGRPPLPSLRVDAADEQTDVAPVQEIPELTPMAKVHAARRGADVEYLREVARREPDWLVRIVAIGALGRLKDTGAVPVLRRLLDAKHSGVRISAMRALGRIGDDAAIDDLYRLAMDIHESNGIRLTAAKVLLDLGDRRVVPLIGETVVNPRSTYFEVKWAIKKLRAIGGVEALPTLRNATSVRLGWRNRMRLQRLLRFLTRAASE